jgi:hypothetical protein
VRKVERKDGKLVNATIDTVRDASQLSSYDTEQLIAAPQYARDVPSAKHLER